MVSLYIYTYMQLYIHMWGYIYVYIYTDCMCAHCQMPDARRSSLPINRNPPTSRMALWLDLAQSVQIAIRGVYAASFWKIWPSLLKGPNHKKQWRGASHKLHSLTCIYLQWLGAFWKVINERYTHTCIAYLPIDCLLIAYRVPRACRLPIVCQVIAHWLPIERLMTAILLIRTPPEGQCP